MINRQRVTMQRRIPFLILLSLYLQSCAIFHGEEVRLPDSGYVTASWYGEAFNGRPTASGEIFDMHDLTCAHKEFPFGTILRVTNPANHKSVIVTVNDRGPFIEGRDLDLSFAAARTIGLIGPGVSKVRIEFLGRDMRYAKSVNAFSPALAGPFTIQVGSFREKVNADRLKNGLVLTHGDVYISSAYLNDEKVYRVRIGTFDTRDHAYLVAQSLADEGYSTLITQRD